MARVIAVVPECSISGGKFEQADLPAAQRKGQVIVVRFTQGGDAQLACKINRIFDANCLQRFRGGDIQG